MSLTIDEEEWKDREHVIDDEDDNWLDTSWAEPHVSIAITEKKEIYDKDEQVKPDVLKNINVELARECQEKNSSSSFGRIQLNDNKAGMSGCDKERINQIIYEASKGSKYFENEQRREKQLQTRIENQKEKLQELTDCQIAQGLLEADKLLTELENERVLTKTIVHIDMDAFYAAVEERDNPSLKSKPMAVGSSSMLCTSNYIARKYGIRAAMPGFIAKKLCSDLVIVPTNFDKYKAVSREFQSIFSMYDPNYCMMSLDEGYLDFTEHLEQRKTMHEMERTFIIQDPDSESDKCKCDLNQRLHDDVLQYCLTTTQHIAQNTLLTVEEIFKQADSSVEEGTAESIKNNIPTVTVCSVCCKTYPSFYVRTFGMDVWEAVMELRSRVEQRTQLTASAGIAPNTMLSKISSDKNKPNGQYRLKSTVEDVLEFVRDLPLCKVSGIGKVSEKMLNALAVKTCHDLFEKRAIIYHLYSSISFSYLMKVSLGIGSTTIERDHARKSISTERTFSELSKPDEMYKKCMELCEALSEDLTEEGLKGKTVTLKLKTVNFEVKTKAKTLPEYTSDTNIIYNTATELLKMEIHAKHPAILKIRLMGVRMSNLLHKSLLQSLKKQVNIAGFFKKSESNSNAAKMPDEDVPLPLVVSDTGPVDDEQGYGTIGKDECEAATSSISLSALNDVNNHCYTVGGNAEKTLKDLPVEQQSSLKDNSCSSVTSEPFICPICNTKMLTCNLQTFNEHVDVCLNKGTIKELISGINREKSTSLKRKSWNEESSTSIKRKRPNKSVVSGGKGSIINFLKKDTS